MRDHSLDRQDNLFDFFHSHLGAAAKDQRTPVSQEGVFYLARVLVERGVEPPRGDRADTLAELHIQAAQGSRIEAIRSYRQLGDQALVTAGFFRDSLNGRAVGLDYYVEMGAAAYARLARLLHGPRDMLVGAARGLDDIYAELGAAFAACVVLLGEVRDAIAAERSAARDTDVLALYERWLETGSPAVARRLQALGVVPVRLGVPTC